MTVSQSIHPGITVMNQLKIGPRLALAFGAILILMFLAIAFGIRSLGVVDERATQIVEGDLTKVQLIGTVRTTTRATAIRLLELGNARSKEDAAAMTKDVDTNNARVEDALAKLKPLLVTADDKALFETIGARRAAFGEAAAKVIAVTDKGDGKRALEVYTDTARPKLDELIKSLGALSESQAAQALQNEKAVKSAYADGRNLLVGFGAVALILGAVLATLIVRSITKPIAESVVALRAVADGHLDHVVNETGHDETAQLLASIGAMQRKLIDREVKDADSRGQIAAIHKAQAIIEFSLDGKILAANDNFLKTLGYTLDEVVGQHHSMFAEPAYRGSAEYRAFWDKLGRGEFDADQYKRIAKGGREVWIEASYNPIFDPNGKPVKVVKYATDITASRTRSADQKGQLEAINKVQAVIEFDLDGKILSANENFLRALGYTQGEIQGQHHSMFIEPFDAHEPRLPLLLGQARSR